MIMPPALRKFTLTTHVAASVGWLGTLCVFLVHASASSFGQDEQMVRAVSLAMALTAWFVILPLGLASLLNWVLFKLLLTAAATGVLLLKLGPISELADAASATAFSSAEFVGLRTSIPLHSVGGLIVLLAALMLAVYKPQGMTRYGLRKSGQMRGSATGTPVWAKVFGIAVALLTLMLGVMLFGGGHGPGAHE